MKLSKILVFSEEPRGRIFVGELNKIDDGYCFAYDHGYMSRASATALGPDLPFSLSDIKSKKFFDSLKDLIPSRDNPAYEQYCQTAGISLEEEDSLVLLTRLGNGQSNFVFELAPKDILPAGAEVVSFRKSLGLSQRQFALFLDIPFPTLQTIEKETAEAKTARRLIQILINDPSSLWQVLNRRGVYLHSRQQLKIERYIREKERIKGDAALERQKKSRQLGYMEVWHEVVRSEKQWSQIELLKAAEQSQCRKTGWPIGVVLHTEAEKPMIKKDGIEVELESGYGMYNEWSLKRNGGFHFFGTFEEDRETYPNRSDFLNLDTRIWRIAEILLHCENLYRTLGVPETEMIEIEITLSGLEDRKLSAANQLRAFTMLERKCAERSLSWTKTMSISDMGKNRLNYVVEVSKELSVLFDGFQPATGVIESIYEEFIKP